MQSATPSFAPDLAAALRQAGIPIHSIGPTRVAPVLYYERVELPIGKKDEAPQSGAAGGLNSMRDETASAAPAGANEEIFNWGAVAMHAREAEAVNVKRNPVTVAVADSGVEDTHPDLEGRVDTSRSVKCSVNGVATQDFYGWRDDYFHGTHVAGSIAAKHDGVGVDGVNPTLRIAAINVASRNGGFFYPEYIVCGFVWVAEHGISVTNGSYYVDPWNTGCRTTSSRPRARRPCSARSTTRPRRTSSTWWPPVTSRPTWTTCPQLTTRLPAAPRVGRRGFPC